MFEGIIDKIRAVQVNARAEAPVTPEQVATRPENLSKRQLQQVAAKGGVEAVIAGNAMNPKPPAEPISGIKQGGGTTG